VNQCFVVFAKELEGPDPRRIAVCWSGSYEDREQRSYLRRARVRLRMAGWERGEKFGQCRRVWSSLPSVRHKWCMCGHWQGGGVMGCSMWPGFGSTVRAVG